MVTALEVHPPPAGTANFSTHAMNNQRSLVRSIFWALGTWLAHLLALLAVIVVLITAVQGEVDLLVQADVDLSSASVAALSITHYFVDYWYTLLLLVAVDAAMLSLFVVAEPTLNWLAWLWSTLWLLGLLLLLAFVSLGIALPVVESFKTAGVFDPV